MAPNVAPGCWAEPFRKAFAPPASPATAPIPQLCPQLRALSHAPGVLTASPRPELPTFLREEPAPHTHSSRVSVRPSLCIVLGLPPPNPRASQEPICHLRWPRGFLCVPRLTGLFPMPGGQSQDGT